MPPAPLPLRGVSLPSSHPERSLPPLCPRRLLRTMTDHGHFAIGRQAP
jgi:hypothetical protein